MRIDELFVAVGENMSIVDGAFVILAAGGARQNVFGRDRLDGMQHLRLLVANGITDAFALLGRRGYYRDTMGAPGTNDLGLYDDAIMLVSPTAYATFNANTDPSRELPGIATLKLGVWRYQQGIHGLSHPPGPRRYPALVQAEPVTVSRDGGADESGYLGINIHHGSINTTSSEGCQTVYLPQWAEFIGLVTSEMAKHARRVIPYCLTEHT